MQSYTIYVLTIFVRNRSPRTFLIYDFWKFVLSSCWNIWGSLGCSFFLKHQKHIQNFYSVSRYQRAYPFRRRMNCIQLIIITLIIFIFLKFCFLFFIKNWHIIKFTKLWHKNSKCVMKQPKPLLLKNVNNNLRNP